MHIFLFILLSHPHDQKNTMRGEIQTRNGIEATEKGKYFERKDTENTKMKNGQAGSLLTICIRRVG